MQNIKIAVLIITVDYSERFKNEIEEWKKYMDLYKNIDCYFIKCDNKEDFSIINSKCKESYIPGIYQKTILSLEKLEKDYDFYLRTNLSSFILFNNLLKKVRILSQKTPFFSGVYCQKEKDYDWVGGYGILLNRPAKEILLNKGKQEKYFNDKKIPDDVLVGKVFGENNIRCHDLIDFAYVWDYNKNINDNMNMNIIKEKHPAVIRLRNDNNIKEYQKVCNVIRKEMYKK